MPAKLTECELDPFEVMRNITNYASLTKGYVLVKEMTYSFWSYFIEHPEWNDVLNNSVNIFLIRNPKEQISSLYDMSVTTNFLTFDKSEIGYDEIVLMIKKLKEQSHHYLIVDGNALAENPKKILTEICDFSNIAYENNMWDWSKIKFEQFDLWIEWHKDIINTKTIVSNEKKWNEYPLPNELEEFVIKYSAVYHDLLNDLPIVKFTGF